MYTGQVAGRQQRLLLKKEESNRKFALSAHPTSSSSSYQTLDLEIPEDDSNMDSEMDEKLVTRNRVNENVGIRGPSNSLIDQIDRTTDGRDLKDIWLGFQKQEIKGNLQMLLFLIL